MTDDKGKIRLNYGQFQLKPLPPITNVFTVTAHSSPQSGMVSNGSIRSDIAHTLKDAGWSDKLDVPTNSLFASLKDLRMVLMLSRWMRTPSLLPTVIYGLRRTGNGYFIMERKNRLPTA